MEFMEAVFRTALYKKCITEGHKTWFNNYQTPDECAEFYSNYPNKRALTYISDRRMDTKKEYIVTNGFGSRREGHSAAQSYVIFIDEFGVYLDGITAHEIVDYSNEVKTRGLGLRRTELLGELETQIPNLEAQLAMFERNLVKIPMVADKSAIAKETQDCEKAILEARYELKVKYALRDQQPAPPEERHWSVNGNACRIVSSRRSKGRRAALSDDIFIGTDRQPVRSQPSPTGGVLGGLSTSPSAPEPKAAPIPKNGVHPEDAIFAKSVALVTVTKMRNLRLKKSRTSPQFSAEFDFSFTGQLDKPVNRANLQILAFPKAGGDPIMFSATLPKGGRAMSAKRVKLFANARNHPGASTRPGDYRVGAVVTRVRYTDGTKDILVPDLDQFKIWMKQQALIDY